MPRRRRLPLLALVASMLLALPVHAGATFTTATSYPAGGQPHAVAAGDFDQDGDLDLVTATHFPYGIALLSNTTNGFTQSALVNVLPQPTDIAVADVNLDNRPDAVVAHGGDTARLSVAYGTASGTLSTPTTTALGPTNGNEARLALGDVNADGWTDAVMINQNDSKVWVALNLGGSFSGATIITVCANVSDVALENVIGTQPLDLIIACASTNQIAVFPGVNSPSFSSPTTHPTVGMPTSLATGSIGGPPTPDIIVTSHVTGGQIRARAHVSTGSSFVQSPDFVLAPAATAGPSRVSTGDVDGDGDDDLVVVNRSVAPMVAENIGGAFATTSLPAAETNLSSGIFAQLDTDAAMDVAIASPYTQAVLVYHAEGAPHAPTDLLATSGHGSVSLTWNAAATGGTPTAYDVYRSTVSPTSGFSLHATVTATSYTDGGLGDGATFYYQVVARNAAGSSAASAAVSATTWSPPGAPGVTAEPGTAVGEVLVQIDQADDGGAPITSYTVCRSTDPSQLGFCATITPASEFRDGGLLPLTTYHYTVTASNVVGTGPRSPAACSKPFPWASALGC